MDIRTTKPAKLLAGSKRHIQGIRSHIKDLTFKGEEFQARIPEQVILAATLRRTIEGASTIRIAVSDPDGRLRTSKLLQAKFDVRLDGMWFRLTGASRTDRSTLELLFQARNVARLRVAPGAVKAKRGAYTRAEFWASQVINEIKGPRIPLWIPELHEVQPIANSAQDRQAAKETGITRGKSLGTDAGGLDPGAKLTVKGIPANAEQLKNGETCLRVGASLGAPEAAMLAVIMAGTQENNMTNANSSGGCMNYFCFISQTAASFDGDYRDLAQTAHSFFADGFGAGTGAIDYAKQGMSPNDICANIERPAEQNRGLYAQWEGQAQEWLSAFNGGGITSAGGTATVTKDYSFERKATESIWANGTRLFEEVNWRLFEAAEVVYVITEPELLSSKLRMHVSDESPGIESITFDYVAGKQQDTVSLLAYAAAWAAPPGTVAVVHQQGPADGRYIVSSIESDLMRPEDPCSIELKRPQKPLPEPAPEMAVKSIGNIGGGNSSSAGTGDLSGLSVNTALGAPHWGGAADLHEQVIAPIARKHGVSAGGAKEGGHTAGGDHDPAVTNAYATDWSGGDLNAFANEVASTLGDASVVHTYDHVEAECANATFTCQVLWQLSNPSPGPGDYAHTGHVHTGARRI